MDLRSRLPLLLLGLSMLLAFAVVAEEATLRKEQGGLRFGNSHLVLRFDESSGVWNGLETANGVPLLKRTAAQLSVGLQVGGKDLFAGPQTQPGFTGHALTRLPQASRLDMAYAGSGWKVNVEYTLWDSGILQRSAVFEYTGPPPPDGVSEVRNALFVLPSLSMPGDDAFWFATAEYPPRDHPFPQTSPGRRFGFPFTESTFRGFIARSAETGLNVVSAYYTEDERARLEVWEGEKATSVRHTHLLAEALRPGLRFRVGSQLLRVVPGTRQDALEALQGFYDLPGLRTRIGMPTDTGRNIFYSAHPGGTIDSSFQDVGGFANFTKLLPSIRELGVNTLWLMPFWYGPVYAPYDYYRLDPKRCGTPQELKALTDKAHTLDMRVLGDLIPHGPREEPGVKPTFGEQHGDWVCRDKDGKMVQWWGCHYCDYANPGWQDYMAKHAAYWVRECGLDGYRVDVAAGGAPNWRPYGDNRPSFSGLRGGLELLRKAREACLKENPNTLFLAESTGPTMYSAVEHGYHWAFANLLSDHVLKDSPTDFVQGMSGYLENQTYAFPSDAFPIRFLTNHDELRARYRYGPNLHRALLALCAFMKGAPLLYHEEEVGNEDFITELYRIRQSYDELSIGSVHYAALGHVFRIEREHAGKRSIVLINVSNEETVAELDLPKMALREPAIFDASTGQRLAYAAKFTHALAPYAYAVLVIRETDELPPAVKKTGALANHAQTVTTGVGVVFRKEGDDVHIVAPSYSAIVDGSRGGLLRDVRGNDGRVLLREMQLAEGARKLFVGCDPLDVAKTHIELQLPSGGMGTGSGELLMTVTAAGELKDREGVPRLSYRIDYTPAAQRLYCKVSLTPLVALPPTKSEMALRFRFAPTTHWFASTTEGDLLGQALRRHPADHGFPGRYWHGAGEAFYDASLQPLSGEWGVLDQGRGIAVALDPPKQDGRAVPVRLLEDKGPDSPAELGGIAAVTAELRLLSSNQPVNWEKGVARQTTATLRFQKTVGQPPQRIDERSGLPASTGFGTPLGEGWSTYGPCYLLRTKQLRARAIRSNGGALAGLTDATGQGLRISDTRFYTDKGLFGEWQDPRGNARNMNATNAEDPEPDTQLVPISGQDKALPALRFRSFFRHPHAGGRSLLNPRVEYEVSYTPPMRDGEGLRIDCGARPHLVKIDTAAFLAYKVSLTGCDQWRVDGGEWQELPEKSQRVWESKSAGHLPKSLVLRDGKTGEWTEFSAFDDCGGQVQNVFLHANRGQAHLFVAFYDTEPMDIRPVWRRAAFTMQAGGK